MFDHIDFGGMEKEFAAGWSCWVGFGDLPKDASFEFRDGFEAAAANNERSGLRPCLDDAAEFASEYRKAAEAGVYANYCAVAD